MVNNTPANAGDIRDVDPCVRRILWRRGWQPRQYPCLENPMGRGAWQAPRCPKESDITKATSHKLLHMISIKV